MSTWWQKAVVYEIYPKSFMDSNGDGIGDIRGIISRLDYLKNLGVDVLWIAPMYRSPNKDNGYDISDYEAFEAVFGSMGDFDELLQTAHEKGLKIVMDLVVNHSSDQHPWFLESRNSKGNPYRDYYIWRDPRDGREPTNWGSIFGGSAWTLDEATGQYYLHQFLPEQPDLNWENPKLRREIYHMMDFWCKKGIDGFRMDVISRISKPDVYEDGNSQGEKYASCDTILVNGPRVHEYLKEMNREVLSRYDLLTVGETSQVTIEEAKKYAGFFSGELNMVFQFEHVESTDVDNDEHGKWTQKRMYLPDLKRVLNKWQTQLEGQAWNSLFWENHDQPRVVSRWGNDTEEYRELSAKMLGTCLHMMKGTPYIYQGEELGMTNVRFTDPEQLRDPEEFNNYDYYVNQKKIYTHEEMMQIISRRGRDNARTPMQWSTEENAGFTTGKPWIMVNPNYKETNAKEQVKREQSVYHYYKKLISLRHECAIITEGSYEPLLEEHPEIFAYERRLGNEIWLILCNFSDRQTILPGKVIEKKNLSKVVLNNYEEIAPGDFLRPWEAMVYQRFE